MAADPRRCLAGGTTAARQHRVASGKAAAGAFRRLSRCCRTAAAAGEEARYRTLAEAILESGAWRANRGLPASRRRRLLGRLMRRALELEIPADLAQNS